MFLSIVAVVAIWAITLACLYGLGKLYKEIIKMKWANVWQIGIVISLYVLLWVCVLVLVGVAIEATI